MNYVAVTYLAIDQYGIPLTTAGTLENLKKALDDYYGVGRDKSECIGFFPYITKYPDEYEGYYQYRCESRVRDLKTDEFVTEIVIEKVKVYCVDFYPHTLLDENGYPLIEGTINLCEDVIQNREMSDEEIEVEARKMANIQHGRPLDEEERYYKNYQKYDGIVEGMKWYREKIKSK